MSRILQYLLRYSPPVLQCHTALTRLSSRERKQRHSSSPKPSQPHLNVKRAKCRVTRLHASPPSRAGPREEELARGTRGLRVHCANRSFATRGGEVGAREGPAVQDARLNVGLNGPPPTPQDSSLSSSFASSFSSFYFFLLLHLLSFYPSFCFSFSPTLSPTFPISRCRNLFKDLQAN